MRSDVTESHRTKKMPSTEVPGMFEFNNQFQSLVALAG